MSLTDFSSEWESKTTEQLTIQLTEELEVFGALALPPVLIDAHRKAVGAFEEEAAAKAAMEALEPVLTLELSDPPVQNMVDGKPGAVLIKDFPARWQASDIGALLHGTVKASSLLGRGLGTRLERERESVSVSMHSSRLCVNHLPIDSV